MDIKRKGGITMPYQDVEDRLYHGHRKVANNTHLAYENEFHGDHVIHPITMKLHGNVVARFYQNHLELYSAGYHTKTTKNRLNLALELACVSDFIRQKDYQWYYGNNSLCIREFKEGMKLNY